jgi:hypothetical protein
MIAHNAQYRDLSNYIFPFSCLEIRADASSRIAEAGERAEKKGKDRDHRIPFLQLIGRSPEGTSF